MKAVDLEVCLFLVTVISRKKMTAEHKTKKIDSKTNCKQMKVDFWWKKSSKEKLVTMFERKPFKF